MRKTLTHVAVLAVVGTAFPALAQQSTRDRDNTTTTRTTQPANRTGQPEAEPWWDDQSRDRTFYGQQDYFGKVGDSSSSTDLAKLSNLAGVWKVTVTRFMPNGPAGEGTHTTSTGFAERRWILDGTKLIEVYTLDGNPNDLPLRAFNAPQGWNTNQPMDWDRDQNMNRDNRSGNDGWQDNQNNTNRNDWDRDNDRNNNTGNRNDGTGNDRNNGTSSRDNTGSTGNNTTGTNRDRTTADNNSTRDNTTRDYTQPGQTTRDQDRTTTQPTLPSRPAERLDPNRDPNQPGMKMHHMGGEQQGMVLWGYNQNEDEFDVVWTDASTSAIRYDTGKLGDDNKLTLTGKYTDPRDNKEYSTRTVIEFTSPTSQKVTMYRDGGIFSSETKVFEITYTRDSQYSQMNGMNDADSLRRNNNSGINNQNNTNNGSRRP